MADFRPLSSVSSNSIEPDNRSTKIVSKVIVANKQPGQLWKKIGIVGSVAVMGGQPVLAQIDIPVGGGSAPAVTTEAEPFLAATPVAPEVSNLVAPPVVVSPEAASPSFSNPAPASNPVPVPSEPVEAITSQVEIEIVTPEVEAVAPETESVATVEAVSEDVMPEVTAATEEEAQTEAVATDVDVVTPNVEIVRPNDVLPEVIPSVEDLAAEYGGALVDPTEYSAGATLEPNAPEVFVSERSTGCEYKVDVENISGCGTANEDATAVASAPRTVIPQASINIGPVSISRAGVRFSGGSTTVAGREFYNTVAKPLVELQIGESFVFPLASPSPITSLFGWRWHPIHNDYRFHSGTDLGAPQGTPILATQSGQVSLADYLGGYGLTVILRHNDNTLESRYAHMSHILVKPGEWVEQGDVIGLVGSTGNSTGPHLHFELHQLTSQGWATVNPNEVLSYALANLNNRMAGNPLQALNIMPTAQASPQVSPPAKGTLSKAVKSETLVKDAPHFRPAQPHAQ